MNFTHCLLLTGIKLKFLFLIKDKKNNIMRITNIPFLIFNLYSSNFTGIAPKIISNLIIQSIPFIVNGSVQQKVFTKAGYSL
jgi:hypothetical protein